jgi:hypothetical protein
MRESPMCPASGHQPSQKRRRTGAALLQVCAILAEKIICSGYLAQQPIRLSQSLFIVESAGAIAHELVRQPMFNFRPHGF